MVLYRASAARSFLPPTQYLDTANWATLCIHQSGSMGCGSITTGRKSITGGVMPAGPARIQFDFRIEGQRFRPTLPWVPTDTNLRRARATLARIKAQIAAGTFCFADEFPRYKGLSGPPPPFRARTCGEVFDAFLRHEEARLARDDLAAVTVVTSHRRILDRHWRPRLGALPLIG